MRARISKSNCSDPPFLPRWLTVWIAALTMVGTQLLANPATADSSATNQTEVGPGLAFYSAFKVESFQQGALAFSDRKKYILGQPPQALQGMRFIQTAIDGNRVECTRSGVLYAVTPSAGRDDATSQASYLVQAGFKKTATEEFHLFGKNVIDRVSVYRKEIEAGEFFAIHQWVLLLAPQGMEVTRWQPVPWSENNGELLYNGIQLPRIWPPFSIDTQNEDPLPVPYLESPPQEIVIDIGRQLFVDDFLIEETNLARTWHKARKYEGNPVMTPETDLERGVTSGHGAMAAPFSGGVWYDPAAQRFKAWYCAGWFDGTAYAESQDGIHWDRPNLDVVPGTNQIVVRKGTRDSASVILDQLTDNPAERYKMLIWSRPQGGEVFTSADGLHWGEPTSTGSMGDRSTIFFNPFRNKWV